MMSFGETLHNKKQAFRSESSVSSAMIKGFACALEDIGSRFNFIGFSSVYGGFALNFGRLHTKTRSTNILDDALKS